MKINKYLEELGLTQMDMPGYYNPEEINEKTEGLPGADCRNQEDEQGFCSYEFFNLDYTLDLFVYSKLCYYREHIAELATPGRLCANFSSEKSEEQEKMPQKLWLEILDQIIEGFKIAIVGLTEGQEGIDQFKIDRARHLLAEYWDCLWY